MEISNIMLSSNITWDFFHIEKKDSTNQNIFDNKYIPTLNNNSVSLINFDNNDNDNGIIYSALGYTFSVYREKKGTNQLEIVSKMSEGSLSLYDYNIANNETYTYYIFKESDDYISSATLSNEITTCWWNWSIVGFTKDENNIYNVDNDNIWLFDLNIESSAMTQNISKTEYKNFTKYPKISIGKSNYSNGSLTCLLGNVSNNKYNENADLLKAWNEFCSNGEYKLLKDRKGNKYLVDIISTSAKIDDVVQEQPNTITFSWTEIGSSEGLTMIGE